MKFGKRKWKAFMEMTMVLMVLFLARGDSVQMETMFSAILLLLSWLDLVVKLEVTQAI